MKEKNKCLKLHVQDGNDTKVNINLPLGLVKICEKFIPSSMVDINAIVNQIESHNNGELVNIETTDNGKPTKVKIFIDR